MPPPPPPNRRFAKLRNRFFHSYPSYIPSRTFASALLGLAYPDSTTGLAAAPQPLTVTIDKITNEELRKALLALYHASQRDAVRFRRSVEQWYDDQMERVSGWYRRRVQKVLFVVALVLTIFLNADTLRIAKQLWEQPTTRAALVRQATATGEGTIDDAKKATKDLKKLPVPLGWHLTRSSGHRSALPARWDYYPEKFVGLLLTVLALMLGAPFWFDLLSKLARLRNSGAPPPASDALRRGEGEEERAGPGGPPATPPPGSEGGAAEPATR
jgi:hypothetical protein